MAAWPQKKTEASCGFCEVRRGLLASSLGSKRANLGVGVLERIANVAASGCGLWMARALVKAACQFMKAYGLQCTPTSCASILEMKISLKSLLLRLAGTSDHLLQMLRKEHETTLQEKPLSYFPFSSSLQIPGNTSISVLQVHPLVFSTNPSSPNSLPCFSPSGAELRAERVRQRAKPSCKRWGGILALVRFCFKLPSRP